MPRNASSRFAIHRLLIAAFLGVALAGDVVRAQLLASGLTTIDTTSGLEWLDVTATANLSYAEVADEAGEWRRAGWRHATTAEICDLFLRNLFPPIPPLESIAGPCPFTGVFSYDKNKVVFDRAAMQALGTFRFQAAPGLQVTDSTTALFDDGTPGRVGQASAAAISGGGLPPFDQYWVWPDRVETTERRTGVGHFLVRRRCAPGTVVARRECIDAAVAMLGAMLLQSALSEPPHGTEPSNRRRDGAR